VPRAGEYSNSWKRKKRASTERKGKKRREVEVHSDARNRTQDSRFNNKHYSTICGRPPCTTSDLFGGFGSWIGGYVFSRLSIWIPILSHYSQKKKKNLPTLFEFGRWESNPGIPPQLLKSSKAVCGGVYHAPLPIYSLASVVGLVGKFSTRVP
jgi:hypothetical protein